MPGPWMPPAGAASNVTAVFAGGGTICASVAGLAPDVCFQGPDVMGPGFGMLPEGFTQVAIQPAKLCALYGGGQAICGDPPPDTERFAQVSVGIDFACGIRRYDNTATCWGSDGRNSDCVDRAAPAVGQLMAPPGEFSRIVSGNFHTCALRLDGTVHCWGAGTTVNDVKMCGQPVNFGQSIAPAGKFIELGAGPYHTCGVRADGTVACWGAGDHMGTCSGDYHCGQSMAPAGGGFVQVAPGFTHTCAMRADRTVQCWGSNYGGKSTPPPDFP
jgi:alpha-tubulin suppressor-like RCC1 family protein